MVVNTFSRYIDVRRRCPHEGRETLHRLERAEWTTLKTVHREPVLLRGREVKVFLREYVCTQCNRHVYTAVADFQMLRDLATELDALQRQAEILLVEVRRLHESLERMVQKSRADEARG